MPFKNKEDAKSWRKTHYKINKEKVQDKSKVWRLGNPERIKAVRKAWYEVNKEKVLSKAKDYRKNNSTLKARKKAFYEANKEKILSKSRAWAKANPNKIRNGKLKKKFGITIEDRNKMFDNQKGKCAICKRHQNEFDVPLGVDHNHETGKIRDLLCNEIGRASCRERV